MARPSDQSPLLAGSVKELRIHVKTGPSSKSQDSDVKVTIVTRNGYSLHVPLTKNIRVKGKWHLFERNAEDVFRPEKRLNATNIEDVVLVQVTNRPLYEKQRDWYLEWIAVEAVEESGKFKACVFKPESKRRHWLSRRSLESDGRETRVLLSRKVIELTEAEARRGTIADVVKQLDTHDYKAIHTYSLLKEEPKDKNDARSALETAGYWRTFHNWAKTAKKRSVLCLYPSTLEEVHDIIKHANVAAMRIRTSGANHSWTNLFPDENQALIDPRFLEPRKGEERIHYDESESCVTILCNVLTSEVLHHQLDHKYNFPFNVILGGVTYGGIVATGCHGVGKDCHAHPDLVEEIHVVDCSNEEQPRIYSKKKDGALMNAVTTSLGLFGFIYKLKFKVKQEEIVETVNSFDYKVDLFSNPQDLKDLVENNQSTEILWFPFNQISMPKAFLNIFAPNLTRALCTRCSVDNIIQHWQAENDELYIRKINPSKEEPKPKSFYNRESAFHYLQEKSFAIISKWLEKRPRVVPCFSSIAHRTLKPLKIFGVQVGQDKSVVQQLAHAIHYRKFVHEGFRIFDLEYAFVVEEDYQNIADACQIVIDTVKKYSQAEDAEHRFPMSLALEMRFMSDSQSLLCPAIVGKESPRDKGIKVAYIEVTAFATEEAHPNPNPNPVLSLWNQFADEIARKWMTMDSKSEVRPLPHWAKAAEVDPSTNSEIVNYLWKNNGQNMEEFLKQLHSSGADPNKIFYNDYLRRVFRQDDGET